MAGQQGIDSRAVVDSGATIGEDVYIGPFCVVGPDVTLGDGCRLEASVVLKGPMEIGPGNVIFPFASLGGPPQDLKFEGERSTLIIGANNSIRESVTMNRGTKGGGGVTSVGDGNLFMAYAHVAHDCSVGSGTVFGNAATLGGHVEVGDRATIGAYSGVHQFCRIADYAFIGGYSVVTQDALPWIQTVGNRAKSYGLNMVGLKRLGYDAETIDAIKQCYNTLFRSKMQLAEALAKVEAELGHVEQVRYFVDFVRASERGVVR
jgi:UDP-N-acetylglucosamine acyltransferase